MIRKMNFISWHKMILAYDLGHSLDLVLARTQPITPAKETCSTLAETLSIRDPTKGPTIVTTKRSNGKHCT